MRKSITALLAFPNSPIVPSLIALVLSSLACGGDPMKAPRNQQPDEDAEAPPEKLDMRAADKPPAVTPDAGVDKGAAEVASPEVGGEVGPTGPLIDNPLGAVPMDLKDVGIFTAFPDLTKLHARAFPFAPKHELWSNGLSKARFAVIPAGQKVDTSKRDAWEFPVGTLFFKTFGTTDATGKLLPVETRLIRRVSADPAVSIEMQWSFHVWEWNPAGTAATLLDLKKRVPRQVMIGTTAVTHNIPRLSDCWNCHIANKAVVIGFDELRLNWKSPTTTGTTLLADVMAKQWLSVPPTAPFITVSGRNPTETAALEYLQGNCAHCHNGEQEAREPGARYPALDLRYTAAVKATVNVMTMSVGTKPGMRIIPRNPANSILLEAVEAIGNPNADPEVKPMPTVGVDRLDPKASMVLRNWIMTVTPAP